ncbi:MAG TPA: pyridoxamine 5'-phosphate oxidase family protein [Pseudonocardiaceae bacterium]|jgi:hypothetical protein|nr:pyridoxamine 5'-phosphate oxidase family protein [Pseudonocardiaceae bacterium]
MTGFHPGELAVQRQAGVAEDAARLARMVAPARLDGGPAAFLARREFAVLTARDTAGRLWTSPLVGPAGFLAGHGTTLDVQARPADADPPHELSTGQPVGLLAIEFAIRRRFRVNGTLTAVSRLGMTVDVDQAYGNCPSYLHPRAVEPVSSTTTTAVTGDSLADDHKDLIRRADTFFLGTVHPDRGADASHKGGRPGFVRVDGPDLWWPDYAGNNLFNSLGNIVVNPEAALLFVDFAAGETLHLSGTAELEWITPGSPGDDDGTGRRVRFHPVRVVARVGQFGSAAVTTNAV